MNTNRINLLACFFAFIWFFSQVSYGHDTGAGESMHQYQDAYLAEKVRAQEAKGIPAKQQQSLGQLLAELVNNALTALFDVALPTPVNATLPGAGNTAIYGEWGSLTTWPFAFASAANLPDGRILAWGSNTLRRFTGGTFTYAAIWDPVTGQMVNANHPTHSMFCGIPVMLEDGRIFVSGGDVNNASSVRGTSTFNYLTQTWTRIEDMAVGRWYNGSVALPNGKVFTAVGQPGSAYPEIWSQGAGWSYLNGAGLQTAILDYPTVTEPMNWLPHLHLAPNGKIFHSGHTPQMHYIDPVNNGNVTPVALTNDWNTANTPGVLFDEGKLLQAGGALYDANKTGTGKAAVIDINTDMPSRMPTNGMQFPRIFHNQVVLPNGEVMVIGGNTTGAKFTDVDANGVSVSQMTPEIWNPITQAWRPVADMLVPRNYHSVALLMTDGRVWSGGGGLCNCSADHPDSQVFSPPYLFNNDGSLATRPEITFAPNLVSYGLTVKVEATAGISKFSMVRMSSTTHALNSDMRFLNVPFITATDGSYSLNLHTNRDVMTPGYWMLFALNAQGVPSVAKIIKVSTSDTPIISNPGDQGTLVNTSVALNLHAIDPNGDALTFSEVALPQGLTINPNTGFISGVPTSTGSSRVVISVTDGVNTATVSFVWNIVNNQAPVASDISGGPGGTAFSDNVAANQFLTGVNVSTGSRVDSIMGILNSGTLAKHGGNGGTLVNVTWPTGEYLVGIYGNYGTYIGKIRFVTNTGRVLGPFGTAVGNNTNSFNFIVPAGHEIVGFSGRASVGYLNALGIVYRVRQIINQPPLVTTVADQIHSIGDTVNLAISATDPDNDSLSYSAIGLPLGLNIATDTGLISGTPTSPGNYDVIVKVQDARGASSALNFRWAVYLPPLIFNPITTTPQPVNTVVNLTASVSNGKNPRFKWSFGDSPTETGFSSSAAVSHTYTTPGFFVVRVTVTDDSSITNTTTFIQAIHLPQTANRPTKSGNMAISTTNGNNRIWVVNQDNDTVSVFNSDTNTKLAEIAVGKSPRAIAIAPDGRIWISNKAAATISIISPTTLQVQQTISLPFASQPFGLAFAPNGGAAYVVLEASGKLLKLNPSSGVQLASLDIGPNPRHIAIQGDSSKLLISRFITKALPGEGTATVQTQETGINRGGEVIIINAATMTIDKTVVLQHSDKDDTNNTGSGIPNYLAMPVISPDGQSAWIPSKQDNLKRGVLRNGNNLNFQNSVRSISSKINLVTLTENYAARIDYDNAGLASAATFDYSGNYLFVALETSREVAIVDAYGGHELRRIQVGRAPDGLIVSADGKKLYINNFMDRTVSVVDLTDVLSKGDWAPPVVATLTAVATEKLPIPVLTGKQLFYDARDLRLASDGYLSCATCHNDGGHDGRVWDLTGFGEGLRNTIDLRGRAGIGQGLLHWTGNFDEIQDFEGQIRSLAGGSGLMSDADFAATQNTLGTPKAGLSADLDFLAAYVASLNAFASSPQRNPDGSLTASAVAGKTLFSTAGCIKCHGGTQFTDSPSRLSHDVGTIKPSSGKRLNLTLTGLDTPTLRDVWNTAPYLHDGSAPTLNDSIRAHTAVSLNDAEIAQVASYIQQVGGNEPALANTPPSVAITTPVNASNYLEGVAIPIAVNASDSDGSVVKVEVYAGSTLLGTDTVGPYDFSWTGAAAGNYALTAKVYDNYGVVSTSSIVGVTVQPNNGTGNGLLGQYFNNLTLTGIPVLQRLEAINFDWLTGSPGLGVKVDSFSVRWTGQIQAPVTGVYQFQTISDDGVRLTVNGVQLINNWTNHAPTIDTSASINLVAGVKYQAVMEYYERSGGATAKLLWATPGQTGFAAVPINRLYNGG
jgi:large repetitive protein